MRTLVAALLGTLTGVGLTVALTPAPEPFTCNEDQVAVWSLDRHRTDVCLDIDDPFTQELLIR